MTGFYILGAVGLLVLGGRICFSIADRRGYKRGFEAGKRAAERNDDEFMRGVLWISNADSSIEETRREIWREGIGA